MKFDVSRMLAGMHRCGITDAEIARAVGVATNTVCTWRSGDRHPKLDSGLRLLEFAWTRYGQEAEKLASITTVTERAAITGANPWRLPPDAERPPQQEADD